MFIGAAMPSILLALIVGLLFGILEVGEAKQA